MQYTTTFTKHCLCISSDIMNNKVFYQHPNLMRVLGMHETVMEVMVNVLGGDKLQVGVTSRHHLRDYELLFSLLLLWSTQGVLAVF